MLPLVFRGVKSVYEFLKERGGLAVLGDPDVEIATREVLANGRPRPQITKDIRRKVCYRCCCCCIVDSTRAQTHRA